MTDDDMTPDALENDERSLETSGKSISRETLHDKPDHSSDDTLGSASQTDEVLRTEAPRERELQVLLSRFEQFQGPLPPPSVLKGYEDIVPGSANRIIIMAEKQQDHRMGLEHAVIHNDILMERAGLAVFSILAVLLVVGGIWLAYEGRQLSGLAVVVTSIAGLAGALVYAQRQRRQELQERKNALTRPLPSNQEGAEKTVDK